MTALPAPRGLPRIAFGANHARVLAFAALALFGALHWMAMLAPAEPWRALAVVLVALGVGAALRVAPLPARFAIALLGVPLALLAAGVTLHELRPAGWSDLYDSLTSGLSASGTAHIPYSGSDGDIRLAVPVGAALLTLLAAVLAFAPNRSPRFPPLVVLVALYAVPAVAISETAEFARGGILALLVLAYLRVGSMRAFELGAGGCLALAGVVLAAAVAPALDRDQPWFDYEAFASRSAAKRAETFDWNHTYSGINWKRTGRELLSVESSRRVYLKAENLDYFDGKWGVDPYSSVPDNPTDQLKHVAPANLRRWTTEVDVSVRDLRSGTLPVAGTTGNVQMDGHTVRTVGSGNWGADRDVVRGDAYRTQAYVPHPTADELQAAGTGYDEWLVPYTSFNAVGVDPYLGTHLSQFNVPAYYGGQIEHVARADGPQLIRTTHLDRTYRLSQQLLAGTSTPYEYVQAVQRYLADGFTYDEHPPASAQTLPGFLFAARRGYCQQFSGAMALLLRMGGVPARVASGFAPGSPDRSEHRYVVRDLDAHSWVEVWFPKIGWVTFDPTPAAAPARSQAAGADLALGVGGGDTVGGGTKQEVHLKPAALRRPRTQEHTRVWPLITAGLGGLTLLAIGGMLIRTRGPRRRRLDAVGELRLAFERAGTPVQPSTTLAELAARHPEAAPYLRALEESRYGTAAPPSGADRAALRRALTRGRPPLRRARTWLAVHPRVRDGARPHP